MPIYEYRCEKCKKVFELNRKLGKQPATAKCPHDGGRGTRIFSAVTVIGAGGGGSDFDMGDLDDLGGMGGGHGPGGHSHGDDFGGMGGFDDDF